MESNNDNCLAAGGILFYLSRSAKASWQGSSAAYFEEWNIHYSGRNIADLEKNGVASDLTHLIYAFGNVTTAPAAPVCAIADP
jgi:hypothetical protein